MSENKTQALHDDDLVSVNGGISGGNDDIGPCFVYTVRSGDCLSLLAHRYGTTVAILQQINDIKNPNLIYEGDQINIPYKRN